MKRGDFYIIVLFIAIILVIYGFNYWRTHADNDLVVEVRIDGDVVDTFDIEEEVNKEYSTEYGINVISIHNKMVSVSEADCRDLICVNTKVATSSGDAIVCIPNHFTVEIVGSQSEVDVIAQ